MFFEISPSDSHMPQVLLEEQTSHLSLVGLLLGNPQSGTQLDQKIVRK
jgi:hypothetical protein